MLLPEGVAIDGSTGAVQPSTGSYVKRLSEFEGIYQSTAALRRMVTEAGDPVTYEVIDYRKPASDLAFGTTIMRAGRVGDEYFMTRGHFHERADRGEVYYTQSGEGILLLESRQGHSRTVEMRPGVCAFIPPDWAHRSVNTGSGSLVFVWVCATDAGHDYGAILSRGMRRLVIAGENGPAIVDNPRFAA